MISTGGARRGLASAAQQFTRIKGLGEIIVSADLKPQNAIHGFAAGGEQEYRNGGLMTQGLQQLESRAAWKHDIENHQLMMVGERGRQTCVMIVSGIDPKALRLEKALKQIDESVIVVDDEQVIHWIYCAFSSVRLW